MRLTDTEVLSIREAVQVFLPHDFRGVLKLYGSRTQDSARGGDIDLVLIVDSRDQVQVLKKNDYKIVAAMKLRPEIGDRKIDFKVLSVGEAELGFYSEALKNSIVLFQF